MKTMKVLTLLILISFGFFCKSADAQITLEHTYNAVTSFHLCNLSISGYKWYLQDSINPNSLKIYNINHSLWKTIPLTPPSGYSSISVENVSEKLFNDDELVEVAYTYFISGLPSRHGAKVTNENGSDLFTFPTIDHDIMIDIVSVGQNGAKMMINYIDNTPPTRTINVYSLPGQLSLVNNFKDDNIETNAYPNPAKNNITIAYDIPQGYYEGDLIIYNSSGVAISRYKVDRNFNTLFIDTSGLPSGVYLYKVIAGNVESKTKKLIME